MIRFQDCKDAEDRRAWKEERRDEAYKMATMHEQFEASYRKRGETELADNHKATAAQWRREYERLKATT